MAVQRDGLSNGGAHQLVLDRDHGRDCLPGSIVDKEESTKMLITEQELQLIRVIFLSFPSSAADFCLSIPPLLYSHCTINMTRLLTVGGMPLEAMHK